MILCRVNAPLVSQCFRFLKAGRKAQIQGRDVGQGLISTIKKQKAEDVPELSGKLDDWLYAETRKESAKRFPNENKLIALQDRIDCLHCFMEGCGTVQEVIDKIEAVFTDDRTSPGIKLSSIHKAKGLEARRVYFLMPSGCGCPHPMAKSKWSIEQEWNLKYVAVTRAIEELVYVS
jgi:superfamily I DNA/RNA helicase